VQAPTIGVMKNDPSPGSKRIALGRIARAAVNTTLRAGS
jgi:hypothetical protein